MEESKNTLLSLLNGVQSPEVEKLKLKIEKVININNINDKTFNSIKKSSVKFNTDPKHREFGDVYLDYKGNGEYEEFLINYLEEAEKIETNNKKHAEENAKILEDFKNKNESILILNQSKFIDTIQEIISKGKTTASKEIFYLILKEVKKFINSTNLVISEETDFLYKEEENNIENLKSNLYYKYYNLKYYDILCDFDSGIDFL